MDMIDQLKADLGKELAIIDIYQKYVKQIHDPAIRKVLLLLISDSMNHADTFRKLLYKKTMGVQLHQSNLNEVALSNLLYFGMKEEREIRLIYEEQLNSIQDPEYATALKKIIEDEKRHEEMLKEVFNKLQNTNP